MTITLNATTGISTPPVSVLGDTSGSITFAAPAVAGTNTQTLVAATGTLAPLIAGTAQASTSGTSIDFTGIPSWVKRITVMFRGVSTSGTSLKQIQLGSGSAATSGYSVFSSDFTITATAGAPYTSGFVIRNGVAADLLYGTAVFTLLDSSTNSWTSTGMFASNASTAQQFSGSIALSGTLDQVRITTVNGTDTFDAGLINILYE